MRMRKVINTEVIVPYEGDDQEAKIMADNLGMQAYAMYEFTLAFLEADLESRGDVIIDATIIDLLIKAKLIARFFAI